jgi:hypothetical protein
MSQRNSTVTRLERILLIFVLVTTGIVADDGKCEDIGTGETSKYTCLDYACLNLCHLGHVKKLCRKTCGLCGTSTVGLPSIPVPPTLRKRSDSQATFAFDLQQGSLCPIKQIEFRLTPPNKAGKSAFLLTVKATQTSAAIRGLLSDITYAVTFRTKSSFGWSTTSNSVEIPRVDWDTPTSIATTPVHSTATTQAQAATTTAKKSLPPKPSTLLAPPTPLAPLTPHTPPKRRVRNLNNEAAHKAKKRRLIALAQVEAREHQRQLRQRNREQREQQQNQQADRNEL